MFRVIFLFLCFVITKVSASNQPRFVVQGQLTFKIGAPINSLGFKTHVALVHPFAELGAGVQSNFHFSGLGPRGWFFENRLQLDAKLVWGKTHFRNPVFFHAMFNNSQKRYSLSYAHYWYWDTRNTTQRSGAWASEIANVFVYFENDLFAGQGRDRFRTGTLQLMYRDSLNLWSANTLIWTGETRGAKVMKDARYLSSRGYLDLSEQLYGKSSHGIFSLSYQRAFSLQNFGVELGIDDERIRHFFQNKLVHDFPYFSKHSHLHNRHLPMLDQEGNPFIDSNSQKLRKTKWVVQGLGGWQ